MIDGRRGRAGGRRRAGPRAARGDGGHGREPRRAPDAGGARPARGRCGSGRRAIRTPPGRSSPSPRGWRPSPTSRRRSGSGSHGARCAASPRPTPEPGDLPSTWFSLATIVLIWAERYAEAGALLETAVAECRAAGAGGNLATALTYRAWLAFRRGDLRAAEVDARTGRRGRRPAAPAALPADRHRHPRQRARRAGRARGGRARAGPGRRTGPRSPPWAPPRCASRARACAWRAGRDARRLGGLPRRRRRRRPLVRALARASSRGAPRPPWPTSLLGDRDGRAARWPTRTSRWRAPSTRPGRSGVALRAAGLAAGGRRGEALLREAVAVLAGADARVEHIRAQTDLGAHLRRANRRAEAREHLRAALDAAHHAGAGALAARAETELRATGARPRRAVLSGLDSLTASERRVAELAARRHDQPRDRAVALRDGAHRRGPSHAGVPEARPHGPRAARRRARGGRLESQGGPHGANGSGRVAGSTHQTTAAKGAPR